MEEQRGVEVGVAAVRRDAQCERVFLVVVIVRVPALGVVIGVVVVVVMVAVLAVLVGMRVLLGVVVALIVVAVCGGRSGRQVGVDMRVTAARVAMDDDALRRRDDGGGENRDQQCGEPGLHPFTGDETRQEVGWAAKR